jgi:hypothetical protein
VAGVCGDTRARCAPGGSGAPPGGGGNGCAWIPDGAGPVPGDTAAWPGGTDCPGA